MRVELFYDNEEYKINFNKYNKKDIRNYLVDVITGERIIINGEKFDSNITPMIDTNIMKLND